MLQLNVQIEKAPENFENIIISLMSKVLQILKTQPNTETCYKLHRPQWEV